MDRHTVLSDLILYRNLKLCAGSWPVYCRELHSTSQGNVRTVIFPSHRSVSCNTLVLSATWNSLRKLIFSRNTKCSLADLCLVPYTDPIPDKWASLSFSLIPVLIFHITAYMLVILFQNNSRTWDELCTMTSFLLNKGVDLIATRNDCKFWFAWFVWSIRYVLQHTSRGWMSSSRTDFVRVLSQHTVLSTRCCRRLLLTVVCFGSRSTSCHVVSTHKSSSAYRKHLSIWSMVK